MQIRLCHLLLRALQHVCIIHRVRCKPVLRVYDLNAAYPTPFLALPSHSSSCVPTVALYLFLECAEPGSTVGPSHGWCRHWGVLPDLRVAALLAFRHGFHFYPTGAP